MTVLKCANSGCDSNSSAVSGDGRIASPAPVSCMSIGPSAIRDTFLDLTSQLLVSDTATNDLFHNSAEPLRIRQRAVVIPEALFIQVPEQMERLNADVGPVESTLQQAPEVLHGVRVDVAIHILYGVIYDSVLVFRLQPIVGFQFVAEDRGASFNPFPDDGLQFFLRAAPDMAGYDFTAALHHTEGDFFILAPRASDLSGPLVFVHVPGLTSDEGFIYFDFPAQLIEGPILHRKPDAVKHEPCGLLGDAKPAMDFIAAHTVFAVDDEPCGREPLFQWQGGVLEDRPGFQGKRWLRVPHVAFPNARLGKPSNPLGAALGTFHDAIRPAQLHHELAAVLEIGEVQNRVSECDFAVHDSSLAQKLRYVKYIIAQVWVMLWGRQSCLQPPFRRLLSTLQNRI